jgi:hypothetical protein
MRLRVWLGAIAGVGLVCSVMAAAQEKGYWRADSSTARSITGDVEISDEKIAINLTTFTIARIRALKTEEDSAIFSADAGGNGSLYRLNVPASKRFLKKNSLCGSDDTQWMVTYVSGRSLEVAFFSGQKPPIFTLDAIANSTDLCGKFAYVR